ncbi:hypothetical protein BGZ61DRAFT_98829 [Ilyonectria robusta]|uniref:uncharacterized protein n=1 Tax=Ilyonectria robusta TaxID=1079257 RepID=UPI001E8E256C|nr:uncharacterized protein BGZ61DRAFT_98829 [Ilyonectria robusta]KAH8675012.1 hypothetical protein BGZ61DRAFT_98829 [Ilyonectria robusta]
MLAKKYAMTPRVSRQAFIWLYCPVKDPDEFWWLLNAAYVLECPLPFHSTSKKVFKFADISLLQLASGTTDVLLGFRLALALEELRAFKPLGRGLCLHCFKTATTKFLDRGPRCPDPSLHSIK